MEGIVYHGSQNGNLKVLEPRKSTHMREFVYATDSKVISLLFMAHGNGDLDTMIGTINDELSLVERREGVLDFLYNRSGYLYTLPADTFNHYDFLWSKEVVSTTPVEIISVENIPCILDEIIKEEKLGNIKIYRYPDRPDTIPLDNSDLIDKYIGFEEKGLQGSIEKLLSIYPEFKEEIQSRRGISR